MIRIRSPAGPAIRCLSTRTHPSERPPLRPEHFLDPKELKYLSRKEITAHDVNDRLRLICPSFTSEPDWKQRAIRYPGVFYRKAADVKQIIGILTDHDFVSDRRAILNNLWVLLFVPQILRDRIVVIRALTASNFSRRKSRPQTNLPSIPETVRVSLSSFNEKTIFWLVKKLCVHGSASDDLTERLVDFDNRINFLAEKLDVFHIDVVQQLDQEYMHRLILRSQQQLDSLIRIYSDIGFQPNDLRDHLWLLTRTQSGVTPRIELLQRHRVQIRPWMLNARSLGLVRVLEQAHVANEFQSISNVLTTKLGIDSQTAESMCKANPNLHNTKQAIANAVQAIDLLLHAGCSERVISQCPKCLTMPLGKLKERLEELESRDCLSLLSHVHESQHIFQRAVKQVIHSQGKDGLEGESN